MVADDQHCTSLQLLQKLDKLCLQFFGYCLDLANKSCLQKTEFHLLLLKILLSEFLSCVKLLHLSQFFSNCEV